MEKHPRKPASEDRILAFRKAVSELNATESEDRLRETLQTPAPYKRLAGRSRLARVNKPKSQKV
jgi:hypothetical protein